MKYIFSISRFKWVISQNGKEKGVYNSGKFITVNLLISFSCLTAEENLTLEVVYMHIYIYKVKKTVANKIIIH